MMHDSMPCGLIQGQGHMTFKVCNSSVFGSDLNYVI